MEMLMVTEWRDEKGQKGRALYCRFYELLLHIGEGGYLVWNMETGGAGGSRDSMATGSKERDGREGTFLDGVFRSIPQTCYKR